ncbi:hypothetical protein QNA08_12460 [Chelatococcus sp. SYSU_G07232]|uniref:Uncharacterized protein n=1 Tax=Chelatococcus albus TaxID=3047466 RepID=A0ABT7AI53_9HYPH|nr:hypothetical protein [Chelatococcus sp. SYSU_G07232]MDJ1159049.1 hypothetical protein [Chelatococcus sp. SYSU_G07232]
MVMRSEGTRGVVVAFPEAAARPRRARPAAGEPCGEILLFTGIRYERHGDEAPLRRPAARQGGRPAQRPPARPRRRG